MVNSGQPVQAKSNVDRFPPKGEIELQPYLITTENGRALSGESKDLVFTTSETSSKIEQYSEEQRAVTRMTDYGKCPLIIQGNYQNDRVELFARKVMEEFQARGGVAVSIRASEFKAGENIETSSIDDYDRLNYSQLDKFLTTVEKLQGEDKLRNPHKDILVVISAIDPRSFSSLILSQSGIYDRIERLKNLKVNVMLTNDSEGQQSDISDHFLPWADKLEQPGINWDKPYGVLNIQGRHVTKIA